MSETSKPPLGLNLETREFYKVMIVEDSIIERTLLKRFLARKQFRVIGEAGNGKDAIENIESLSIKPDIVFIDHEMPVMDGLTAIKRLKPKYPEMKFFMVTNHSESELIQQLLQIKINSFILKPIDEFKLVEKVAQGLGRKDLLTKEVVVYKSNNLDLTKVRIPPLPNVVIKALQFDPNDPSHGSYELEKVISPDTAISTNIIRVANSAYYGRSGSIHNLKDAITLLGTKTVKNLVFLEFNKNMSKGLKAPIYEKHLKESPLLTSLISFDLVNPFNLKKLREDVFLASLFRKIGMMVFALNFEKYKEVLKIYEFGLKDLSVIEKEEFKIDSIQLGIKIFKLWKMPDFFLDVISKQNFSTEEVPTVSDVDRITRLAEILSKKMLQITLTQKESELEDLIFQYYKVPEETKELFGEDYFQNIKDHPFFSLALG
ncbi:MAG: HDOD domain-containing protein [Leptospiraceae bacterium]|nr:HDOD domain-containing protein [Leptospiraceae bacterium]MCP5497388.1 HDOD domain-containing protein [Leptospiraceae bacterium]